MDELNNHQDHPGVIDPSQMAEHRECEEEVQACVDEQEEDDHALDSNVETEIVCMDDILWDVIQSHGSEFLIFHNNDNSILSKEVLSILEAVSKNKIELVDVDEINNVFIGFSDALQRLTGNCPPSVFYQKMYIGNFLDVFNASHFGRLDLLLEPPLCPFYHIIIIGSGHGVQSVIKNLRKLNVGMKVALIEIPTYSPHELESRLKGGMLRKRLWNGIRHQIGSTYDPSEFWYTRTPENVQDISLRMQCQAASIEYFRGTVQFLSKDLVVVSPSSDDSNSNSEDDCSEGQKNILGMNFIICSASQALVPEFPGSQHCIPLEKIIHGVEIPPRALIIGNSTEVIETAYLFALSGGEVTVMTYSKCWLPQLERWCVNDVLSSFSSLQVTFLYIRKIHFIKQLCFKKFKVRARLRTGRKCYTGTYTKIIIDPKRVPISHSMDLEQADIKLDKSHKILVNKFYQTTNPAIYAFGSIVRGHPENPKFENLAAKRTIRFIIDGNDDISVPRFYPFIIYTPLEYAFCGQTENSYKLKCNEKFVINVSENCFFHIKLICIRKRRHSSEVDYKKGDDKVIGIHILGHNVFRLIYGLNRRIERGITKDELVDKIIRSSLFKGLPLNRISFTSRKIRNNIFYPCGVPCSSRDNQSETDTDNSSLFIKTWSRTSVKSLPKDQNVHLIDINMRMSLLCIMSPILMSLLYAYCGRTNESTSIISSDSLSEEEESSANDDDEKSMDNIWNEDELSSESETVFFNRNHQRIHRRKSSSGLGENVSVEVDCRGSYSSPIVGMGGATTEHYFSQGEDSDVRESEAGDASWNHLVATQEIINENEQPSPAFPSSSRTSSLLVDFSDSNSESCDSTVKYSSEPDVHRRINCSPEEGSSSPIELPSTPRPTTSRPKTRRRVMKSDSESSQSADAIAHSETNDMSKYDDESTEGEIQH